MKIVHFCIANFYIEGMGYQENILPRIHKKMGNDVYIITSDYAFDKYGNTTAKEIGEYINPNGIKVAVLKRETGFFSSRVRRVIGIDKRLQAIKPDIIFVHGGQFIGLKEIIKYVKKNKEVKLFIDQHGDYYNMPVKGLKATILLKYIYGHYIRKAVKYTQTFWGVTPWRCQYLHEVFGVPKHKIDLLVMGGDDDKIDLKNRGTIRKNIREKLHLRNDDFVIMTGGKIDRTKNIHLLMQAVSRLQRDTVKLIVFGQPNEDMKAEIEELSKNEHIQNIGWIPADSVYDYFLSSDLVVFPGTHSVLWEQACACGIPALFKDWEGMHHVDLVGNCLLLKEDSVEELTEALKVVLDEVGKYESMKRAAQKGIEYFSYHRIAKQAIGWQQEKEIL